MEGHFARGFASTAGLASAVEAPALAVPYIRALAVSPGGTLRFRLVVELPRPWSGPNSGPKESRTGELAAFLGVGMLVRTRLSAGSSPPRWVGI